MRRHGADVLGDVTMTAPQKNSPTDLDKILDDIYLMGRDDAILGGDDWTNLKPAVKKKLMAALLPRIEAVLPEMQPPPKMLKQTIFSEKGDTTLITPDVFGHERVSGFNAAIDAVRSELNKLRSNT